MASLNSPHTAPGIDVATTMSFPAILRNPGMSERFAHLNQDTDLRDRTTVARNLRRDEHEGKRWIRRKENARFSGNPHIVMASKADHLVPVTSIRTTFPKPLPPYISRMEKAPSVIAPIRDPNSANAGRFSFSLKGMRRELRRCGARAQFLVQDVEQEIVSWLREGGTVLAPDMKGSLELDHPGISVRGTQSIKEVSRTPLQLVWFIGDDAFARYIVHCVARYHEIVSFSKEVASRRLTYLLRPNVTRPDFAASSALNTPPVTDLDSSALSDFASDLDLESDTERSRATSNSLVPISEDSDASYPLRSNVRPGSSDPPQGQSPQDPGDDKSWSIVEEADGDASGSEDGFVTSFQSLSVRQHDPTRRLRTTTAPRSRLWGQARHRSGSSPSRSPARMHRKAPRPGYEPPQSRKDLSFYDYLFA